MNTYSVYDSEKGLFDDEVIIIAKNATEAVKKYMKNNSIPGNIKRDGSNYVRFMVTKTKIVDNKIYKIGRVVWFKYID